MAVLDHFLFNSDYPTDKIVWSATGRLRLSSSLWETVYDIKNTKIPTQLYLEGDYIIEGSDEVYPLFQQGGPLISTCASYMYNGECWGGPVLAPYSEYANKYVNYRIWAYCSESDAKNIDMGSTSNISKPKLAFTSDENYPRFIGDGFIEQGQNYVHNMGYIPLVKAWSKYYSDSIPHPGGGTIAADTYQPIGEAYFGYPPGSLGLRGWIVQANKNQISTYTDTDTNMKGIYYRMYML